MDQRQVNSVMQQIQEGICEPGVGAVFAVVAYENGSMRIVCARSDTVRAQLYLALELAKDELLREARGDSVPDKPTVGRTCQ